MPAATHPVGASRPLAPLRGAALRSLKQGHLLLAIAAVLLALSVTSATAAVTELDVVFAVDESGSMRQHDPDGRASKLVLDFTRALARRPEIDAQVGLVTFADSAQLQQPLGNARSETHRIRLERTVAALETNGQRTDSPAGIERALYELDHRGRPDARRAIVFITDGVVDLGDASRNRASEHWLREDLAKACADAGVRVYGVAFTDAADFRLIQSIAQRTDARYHRAETTDDLLEVMDAILVDLIERPSPIAQTAQTAQTARAAGDPAPEIARPAEAAPETAPAQATHAEATATSTSALEHPPAETNRRIVQMLLLPLAVLLLVAALLAARRARRTAAPVRRPRRWAAAVGHRAPRIGDAAAGVHLVDVNDVTGHRNLPLGRHQPIVTIGREAHNDVVIPRSTLSASHACIELREDGFYLEDRQSTNGTWLNGRRLSAHRPVLLKTGDEIRFADFDFAFEGGEALHSGRTEVLDLPDAPPRRRTGVSASGGSDSHTMHFPAAEAPEAASSEQAALPPTPSRDRGADPPGQDTELFIGCLDGHLERVAEMSPGHRSFVDDHFSSGLREALAVAADDLMIEARRDQLSKTACYGSGGVLYVVCVVPDELERAPAWMGWSYGGFSRLLRQHVGSDGFQDASTRALCLITFGRGAQAWLTLSLVAAAGCDERIDLLSSELLSEAELAEFKGMPRDLARPKQLAPTSRD